MLPLIEEHKTNTGIKADTVIGDSKYGTIENFLTCHDIGIKAHIPDFRKTHDIYRRKIHIPRTKRYIHLPYRQHHEKEIPTHEPSEHGLWSAEEGLCSMQHQRTMHRE